MSVNSRFEISLQTHHSDYSMRSAHTHSYYELYYLTHGECNFFLYDSVYHMTEGTMVFIPADTLHRTTYLGRDFNERIDIEFTLDYVTDMIETIGQSKFEKLLYCNFFTISEKYRNMVWNIMKQILREKQEPDSYSKCMLQCLFQQLLSLVLRHCNNALELPEHYSTVSVVDASIQQAMNYICHNYSAPLTLNDVAAQLHLNPSYFSKKFKKINGFSFKEYLNTVRISHAEKLLLETKKNMTEIAFECGYDNSNYFGDAFKRLNGISPTDFRKIKGNIEG